METSTIGPVRWVSNEGTCHQVSQPEFGSQNPHNEKRGLSPTDHALVSAGVP